MFSLVFRKFLTMRNIALYSVYTCSGLQSASKNPTFLGCSYIFTKEQNSFVFGGKTRSQKNISPSMALALKYMAVYSSMTFGSESIGNTKEAISKILRNFSRNSSSAGGRWTQAVNKSCKSVYLMPKSIHTSMYLKKGFYRILPVYQGFRILNHQTFAFLPIITHS